MSHQFKNSTDEPIFRAEIDTDVENRRVQWGRRGRGGMNWEIRMDIDTTLCEIDRQLVGTCYKAQEAQSGAL